MWTDFNPTANPLLAVLRAAGYGNVTLEESPRRPVDLEISSVYPSRLALTRGVLSALAKKSASSTQDVRSSFVVPGKSVSAARGLWYTAENRRPPSEGWEGYLSYEIGSWPDNAYLPFWQLNSDLFGPGNSGFLGQPLRIEQMLSTRQSSVSKRSGFCAAVIRNPDPVRMRAIQMLQDIGPVDVYGLASGRPIRDKMTVLQDYRFVICFENDLYPGYVTEKVFDAWATGGVPIYWGLDQANTLNPEAVVNVAALDGLEAMVETVQGIDGDPDRLDHLARQPILRCFPDTSQVLRLVRKVIDSI